MALKALWIVSSATSTSKNQTEIYLEEPKKIQPKMMTKIVVRYSAFRGSPSLLCTLAKNGDAGRPPSRAKA